MDDQLSTASSAVGDPFGFRKYRTTATPKNGILLRATSKTPIIMALPPPGDVSSSSKENRYTNRQQSRGGAVPTTLHSKWNSSTHPASQPQPHARFLLSNDPGDHRIRTATLEQKIVSRHPPPHAVIPCTPPLHKQEENALQTDTHDDSNNYHIHTNRQSSNLLLNQHRPSSSLSPLSPLSHSPGCDDDDEVSPPATTTRRRRSAVDILAETSRRILVHTANNNTTTNNNSNNNHTNGPRDPRDDPTTTISATMGRTPRATDNTVQDSKGPTEEACLRPETPLVSAADWSHHQNQQLDQQQHQQQKMKHEQHEQQRHPLHPSTEPSPPPLDALWREELSAWETRLAHQAAALEQAQLQLDRREQRQTQDLSDAVSLAHQDVSQQERQCSEWQAQLEAAARRLDQERHQLDEDQRQFEAVRQAGQAQLDQERESIGTQQRRLAGAEQRIEAQAVTIQERTHELNRQQDQLRHESNQLETDQRSLAQATDALEQQSRHHDAQFEQQKRAHHTIVQQCRAQETELARLQQNCRDEEEHAAQFRIRTEREQSALREALRSAQAECDRLHEQIAQTKAELATIAQRKQTALEADQVRRQATAAKTAQADQTLTAVLQQLEVAQREKATIAATLLEKRQELDSVEKQMIVEEERWHTESRALEAKTAELENLQEKSTQQTRDMIAQAEKKVHAMEENSQKSTHAVQRELERQRKELYAAIRSHERNVAVWRQTETLQQETARELLEERNALAAADHRDKKRIAELESKVEKLTHLVQKERANHTQDRQRMELTMRTHQREFQEKMSLVSQELADTATDREEKSTDNGTLRQGLIDRDVEIQSMRTELSTTRSQLKEAQQQLQHRHERNEQEMVQMKRVMDRLEEQALVLDQQKVQFEQDRLQLEANEKNLLLQRSEMDHRLEHLSEQCTLDAREKQAALLFSLLRKPWRDRNESVSLAFSNWIRSTLLSLTNVGGNMDISIPTEVSEQLFDMEREIHSLQEQRDEAYQANAALDHSKVSIQRSEALLSRKELTIQDQERQIAEANDRIRFMASQLLKKEADLNYREAQLAKMTSSAGVIDVDVHFFDNDGEEPSPLRPTTARRI